MKTKSAVLSFSVLLVIVFAFGITMLWEMALYDRLDLLSQEANKRWSEVEKAYEAQVRLIPKLRNTFSIAYYINNSEWAELDNAQKAVEDARLNAQKAPRDAAMLAKFEEAQGALSLTLGKLIIKTQHYPEAADDTHFKNLQIRFAKSEDKIMSECERFNEAAEAYNKALKSIPGAAWLKVLGQHEKPYFAAVGGAGSSLKVGFDFEASPLLRD